MTLEPGQRLGPVTYRVTRADLVRYAGASGDDNPIHWSDRVAVHVGLPGVIAHGMYTLALAGRAATAWAGGPQHVHDLGARFTRPVVVPDDEDGVEVAVGAVVVAVDEGRVRLDLTVTVGEESVLGRCRAVVDADA